MNNPKLTNGLLIAVLALNFIIFLGWACTSMHYRHHRDFASRSFNEGRGHNRSFAYNRGCRSDRENYGGSHRGFRHHFRGDNYDRQ